jgi:hypothetical protein
MPSHDLGKIIMRYHYSPGFHGPVVSPSPEMLDIKVGVPFGVLVGAVEKLSAHWAVVRRSSSQATPIVKRVPSIVLHAQAWKLCVNFDDTMPFVLAGNVS